jgi:23S rRNA (pseudouridine1915-N3)-methyltransferase
MSAKFGSVKCTQIFSNDIAKAQSAGAAQAKRAYSAAYEGLLGGYNVALDEDGELMSSQEFARMMKDKSDVRFFVGGAYGFEEGFLDKAQKVVSLSKMTFAHKVAKIALLEQIYRGLCINNNHPYHKE